MSELNLSFLGSPYITSTKIGEIAFPNRKALALFAYLVIETDHSHSRESLMGLLWPELPTTAAQNNLRVTWSQLRRYLKDDQDDSAPCLLATRLNLQFNPHSDYTLDVTRFYGLLETCRTHPHPDRFECSECAERLSQAIELVRGEFLAGFSLGDCPAFDEWLFIHRERLHLQITTALEQLVDFHEHAGERETAQKYARRLLELEPLREAAHRQMMRLLAAAGRRSSALEQYETCRRLLANELGVPPTPETVLLAEQIRSLAPTPVDASRHNLPPVLNRFIGRSREMAQLQKLFIDETARVVTLVGTGGVGKTRLALQVAHTLVDHFRDGVWLIELASVQDATAVPGAVAGVLDVLPDPRRSLTRTLSDYLRDKSILLLLDNCEHLLETCAQLVKTLRSSSPGLMVLSTSRIPLHLEGEKVVRLEPLPSPDLEEGEALTAVNALEFDSIKLFTSQAMQALLSFSITDANALPVAQICHHLDGIPLAIELAAALTAVMPVEGIAKRLDQRFRWLNAHGSGTLPRQQTLHSLIDWSYELLNERERNLFCRLSVFVGGWTLEAAEAVCEQGDLGADTLGRLVDQSLVVFGYDPEHKRYRMHETVRQFAAEKLASMGVEIKEAASKKHYVYFMELLASQGGALQGRQPQSAVKLIQMDLDNIRQAWHWGAGHGLLASYHPGVNALTDFYETIGSPDEGERLLTEALSHLEGTSNLSQSDGSPLQIDLLLGKVRLLIQQAKLEAASKQAKKALSLAENLHDSSQIGRAHLLLGQAFAMQGATNWSRASLEAALVEARRADDLPLEGEVLRYLGTVLQDLDERQPGETHLLQALQIMQRLGNRSQEQAILLYLGVSAIEALDYVTGRMYLEESLGLIQSTGNRPLEARIQNAIGFVNAALGELETALLYHERSRLISHEIGNPFQESHACHNLCTVNRKLGRLELAEYWGREALLLAQQNDLADPVAYAWLHLGYVFRERGKLSQAEDAFIRSRDEWLALEHGALAIEAVAGVAGTKWKQGELTEALSLVEELLDAIAQDPLEGVDEPMRIYLTCFHILHACGDWRADDVLRQAYDRLIAIAEKIYDPAIRTTFLERVPAHRELVQLWKESGS